MIKSGKAMVPSRKRSRSAQRGMAAVEFALIAPVFFALMFGIIETGWLMIKISLVDNAVEAVGRDIYTGAAVSDATITQDSLKTQICNMVPIVKDCEQNIALEVTTITGFDSIPTSGTTCRDSSDSAIQPKATYSPGSGSSTSFVRVCVTTGVLAPFIGAGMNLTKNANGNFEIISMIAFANEPF